MLMQNYWREKKGEIVMVVVLLVVVLVPRLFDLGEFLTADEKNWIGRSYEFVKAFKDWRFNEMLQTTHPGVTTLWLSGVAVTAKMLLAHIPFSFRSLVHFVWATQTIVALTNAGIVILIYVLLRQLWPKFKWVAWLAALLISLDPFIVGYSRVVHVDAMLGGFMMAAGIAILAWGQRWFNRRWLVAAAGLTALAGLTKVPAVFLLPFLVLVVLVQGGARLRERVFIIDRCRDGIIWLLLIGIIVVIVWPAILWVPNPAGNVLVLKRDISIAAITPHDMTSEYSLNGSFYWLSIITRSTPVVLGLLLVALVSLIMKGRRREYSEKTMINGQVMNSGQETTKAPLKTLWLLVAYIFFFVVMMMLGAKKGDRYILPVFFAMDIMAAWGWWYIAVSMKRIIKGQAKLAQLMRKFGGGLVGGLIIAYMGVVVYQYHPYAIAYSNPLLPDNLSQELGWGEGLELVGAWLNEHDPEAVVASWYPEELGAYTSAHVAHINAHEQSRIKYVVLYRNMFGREPDHYANNFIDEYYKKREPVYTVKIVGKEFAWVYEKKVYERVLEELVPGETVSQVVEVTTDGLMGVDIKAATYSGQATEGYLTVELVKAESGEIMKRWKIPVMEIDDSGWTNFMLDESSHETGKFKVNMWVSETGQKAPTIRYQAGSDYREDGMVINGQTKNGNLAVRLRYKVGTETVTEDDTKRLR